MSPADPTDDDRQFEYPLAGGNRLRFRHATREYHPEDAWIYFSRLPPHAHPDLHIVIPLTGTNRYRHVDGLQDWAPHQGVLINSWEPHEVRPQEPGALEYTQLTFLLADAEGKPLSTTWNDLAKEMGGRPIDRSRISKRSWQAVTPEALSAVEALQARDAIGMAGRVLTILSRLGAEEPEPRPSELILIEERVRQNVQRSWTTGELADLCGWSTGYLHRRCRQVYQCTPMDLVYRIRLERAKQLLLEGQLQLQSVARLCGFNDAYHFSRRFKQRHGISPRAMAETVYEPYCGQLSPCLGNNPFRVEEQESSVFPVRSDGTQTIISHETHLPDRHSDAVSSHSGLGNSSPEGIRNPGGRIPSAGCGSVRCQPGSRDLSWA